MSVSAHARAGDTLGVAVIGLGVGEQHARAFAAHPACRVRCLYDLDRTRAERLARELGEAAVADGFEQVLERADVDIVSIASYDDAHYAQVVQALEAGKHVFVEKPICRTLGEIAEIKARWLAAGGRLKLRSNLVLRGAPLYRWLRSQLRENAFGRVYSFDGDYLYGRLHKITDGWRGKRSDYSVMEGGGVHLVDLLMWLTGERPASVSAASNRICTQATGLDFDDFAAATLQFDSGLVARITANFGCVHRHQHVVRVFGTDATLLYDDAGPRLHRSRDPAAGAEILPHAPLPSSKGILIPEFVAAVLTGADDSSETRSFFDAISVCVAADRAAITRSTQKIEYL